MIGRHIPLTDEELEDVELKSLKLSYAALRRHHIEETTELRARLHRVEDDLSAALEGHDE